MVCGDLVEVPGFELWEPVVDLVVEVVTVVAVVVVQQEGR